MKGEGDRTAQNDPPPLCGEGSGWGVETYCGGYKAAGAFRIEGERDKAAGPGFPPPFVGEGQGGGRNILWRVSANESGLIRTMIAVGDLDRSDAALAWRQLSKVA
jgi:hypothetical protein